MDGWQDIATGQLIIYPSVTSPYGVYVYYNQNNSNFYLYNDETGWLNGTGGSTSYLETPYGKLMLNMHYIIVMVLSMKIFIISPELYLISTVISFFILRKSMKVVLI